MPQAFPLAFSRPWPAARTPRLSSSKARFLLNSQVEAKAADKTCVERKAEFVEK